MKHEEHDIFFTREKLGMYKWVGFAGCLKEQHLIEPITPGISMECVHFLLDPWSANPREMMEEAKNQSNHMGMFDTSPLVMISRLNITHF